MAIILENIQEIHQIVVEFLEIPVESGTERQHFNKPQKMPEILKYRHISHLFFGVYVDFLNYKNN